MTIRTGLGIAALGCVFVQVPAGAENAKLGRTVLSDFAKCAVKNERELAKKLVLGARADSFSDDELQRVFDARCFGFWGVNFRANDLALRAAFAEELVRRDLKQWPELNPSGLSPLNWAVARELRPGPGVGKVNPAFVQEAQQMLAADARVGQLGECVVRSSPKGAVGVLTTKIDSRAELDALKGLTQNIAVCVKAGETAAFSRTSLRYAIALSYYKLAYAPRMLVEERR